ncbi:RHS repeat domain-containing protein [Dyella mobilis]|uniref:RHS repeat-associated core domain-containing protein n=1 Tax=Dyella mobilis TaxID=1849582 RepID=A0ABS2KEH3_9GAMM|nr:RHS repeat-associated core domain-containing protein [Dyella mobilis]MBM7129577.1 RHS repeat-associated core domain-containing protein [Dyella mobilis]GLQ98159.1 hypothetical protein GCM10007863_25790 [Dyella mobilis]
MAGQGSRGLWIKLFIYLLFLITSSALHAQQQGTVTYVYTDPQGTPLAEADANGNITQTYDYTPYGTTALGTSPSGPGYTGHVNDPETNLVYMQARYYDPVIAHFLSVDPVGIAPGNAYKFNRYGYANNNPILNIDPNGRQSLPLANELGTDDPALIDHVQVAQLEAADNFMEVADQLTQPLVAEQPELGAIPAGLNKLADVLFSAVKIAPELKPAVTAESRAQELAAMLDPVAQNHRTVAVLDTTQGVRILGQGGRDLEPAQRATQMAGEILGKQSRAHAEITVLSTSETQGYAPSFMATSRPFCPDCQQAIQQSGGTITSPTTAVWRAPLL